MKTIILPGYSLKNKGWAHQTSTELVSKANSIVFYWSHWEDPEVKPEWQKEAEGVIKSAGGEEFNLLAKSIGTFVSIPRDDHEYYYSEDFKRFLAPES